ncbi:MerR family transcriptional regulator [Puniceicoccaceae bacterium K14]|nr:MerR family transcriptional regulator [Puniceicoccaceae bacterium K14]
MSLNIETSNDFKIGAAAKLAGISPNTIRTWIRRNYFTPSHVTESGNRLISSEDIKRLVMMKTLISSGDSISSIASLTDDALAKRLAEATYIADSSQSLQSRSLLTNIKPAFLGENVQARYGLISKRFWSPVLIEKIDDLKVYLEKEGDIDIILIDFRLSSELRALVDYAKSEKERTVVALFDFLPREIVKELSDADIQLIRGPINADYLEKELGSILSAIQHKRTSNPLDYTPPARIFDDAQLSQISNAQPTIKCECPRHISSIVSSLAAFEDYSKICEVQSTEDREFHNYLADETARARHIMELALVRLCAHDGISIT